MSKASYRDMTGPNGLLANRQPFQGNSMSAKWEGNRPYAGRLYPDEIERLNDTFARAGVMEAMVYVVYSYATPIAWAIEGEPAYCVDQRFSVTTSKGQTYVRAWINHNYRDTVSQGVPPNAEYLAERERLFGCGHTAWRWLDCQECSDNGVTCDVKVCVSCGATVAA